MTKIIQQGAEAIISLQKGSELQKGQSPLLILKNRVKKSYRLPELDTKLRTRRTKSEAKILEKLKSIINVPKIISTDKNQIIMQYIDGKKLSEHLEYLDYKTISKKIGETLTKLHNQNIIHGDLTTSNMIYVENNSKKSIPSKKQSSEDEKIKDKQKISKKNKIPNNYKLYLIDFGLGFHSYKIEDKAVDLHLLKQALEAKHYKIADKCFQIIIKNYTPEQHKLIIERIPVIESRGRYKKK